MDGITALRAFRSDVGYVDDLYGPMLSVDRADPLQEIPVPFDPSKPQAPRTRLTSKWQKMRETLLQEVRHPMIRMGLFHAFRREVLQERPADMATAKRLLAGMRGTLDALIACLELGAPSPAGVHNADPQVTAMAELDLVSFDRGAFREGRSVRLEKAFYGGRGEYPLGMDKMRELMKQEHSLSRVAVSGGQAVGHFIGVCRNGALRIVDWAVTDAPVANVGEAMAKEALLHVSLVKPDPNVRKYAGIAFGIKDEHAQAFAEAPQDTETTHGRRYFL